MYSFTRYNCDITIYHTHVAFYLPYIALSISIVWRSILSDGLGTSLLKGGAREGESLVTLGPCCTTRRATPIGRWILSKVKYGLETDSKQVPRGKDEKRKESQIVLHIAFCLPHIASPISTRSFTNIAFYYTLLISKIKVFDINLSFKTHLSERIYTSSL